MPTRKTIRNANIAKAMGIAPIEIPKYSSSVINSANGYARATRAENVSFVSDTIKKFREDKSVPNHSYEQWIKWYSEKYPNAIQKATDEAWAKFQEVLENLSKVQRDDIEAWEKDLIINKTYSGLMIQDAIINQIAKGLGVVGRLGTTEDEGKGIDGYINDIPVQIKADTYRGVNNERFDDKIIIIYYSKDGRTKDITFEYEKNDFIKE